MHHFYLNTGDIVFAVCAGVSLLAIAYFIGKAPGHPGGAPADG